MMQVPDDSWLSTIAHDLIFCLFGFLRFVIEKL